MTRMNDIMRLLGHDLLNAGLKISYPVTGNLSTKVKAKLEDGLGNRNLNFSLKDSTVVSYFSNFALYSWLGYSVFQHEIGAYVGALYAAAEAIVRCHQPLKPFFNKDYDLYRASLPGKIVSMPIEYGISVAKRAGEMDRQKEEPSDF